MDEQNANKDRIINTLRSFESKSVRIKATVGPTVTLYEITLSKEYVFLKSVVWRMMAIKPFLPDGTSVSLLRYRVKGTIGIEVPNKNPKIVSGQSVIGSKKFQESKFDLPIVLGKTITNRSLYVRSLQDAACIGGRCYRSGW